MLHGKRMAAGGIEKQFYAALLDGLGLAGDESLPQQQSWEDWPAMKERFAAIFKTQDRCRMSGRPFSTGPTPGGRLGRRTSTRTTLRCFHLH